MALERALNGQPVVTKASDVNTLVSAAAKALSLADEIRVKRGDNTSREQIIAEMDRILDLAESRRRQDAVDALRAFGITEEQMLALGLRAEDGVRVDMSIQAPDEQQVVVSADEGIAVEPDEMAEEASTDRRVRDVAVLAPQPPPAPTRFSELFDSEG